MILYAHTDGRLGMALHAPAETLPILSADPVQLVDAVAVLADFSLEDGWRVPGLGRGVEGLARLNALDHFAGRIRFRLAGAAGMSGRIMFVLAIALPAEAPTVHLYTPEYGWACWAVFCQAVDSDFPVTCRVYGCDVDVGWHPSDGFRFGHLEY